MEEKEKKPRPTPEILDILLRTSTAIVIGCICDSWVRWWGRGFFGLLLIHEKLGSSEETTPFGKIEVPKLGSPQPTVFFFNSARGDQLVVVQDIRSIDRSLIKVEFCPFCGQKLDLEKVYKLQPVSMKLNESPKDNLTK